MGGGCAALCKSFLLPSVPSTHSRFGPLRRICKTTVRMASKSKDALPSSSSSAAAPESSSSPSPSSAIDFLTLCHRLKTTKRAGWVLRGVHEPESVADHMYRMGIMALISQDIPGVDRDRCVKMAIVHDIAEVYSRKSHPLRCLSFPGQAKLQLYHTTRRNAHTLAWATTMRTHGHLIKSRAAKDIYTWNVILSAYGRHSRLEDAHKVFDEIPLRDTVSWNAFIATHVSRGKQELAWEIFKSMRERGLAFDMYTLGSVLKSIARAGRLDLGNQLHSLVAKTGLDGDVYCGSSLVDMYAKCGQIKDANLVFHLLPVRNVVSWNAMIAGLANTGSHARAIRLFYQMEKEGIMPDEATFASIATIMDGPKFYKGMLQLHSQIIKYGWARDTIACNAAITTYAQCGSINDAEKVFREMDGIRDLVSWNSLLAAYACGSLADCAIKLFSQMVEIDIVQDMYTFTSAISACFEKDKHYQGRVLHGLVTKKGLDSTIPVSNSLIAMYIKSGDGCAIEDSIKCFDLMEFRDNVSWNSLLAGLSQSGFSEEAMKFFCRMQSCELKIDHFAFSAALRSCSDLATLQLGRQVHGTVIKSGFGLNDFVVSSLIYMYSKSGVLDEARRTFNESYRDSSVTWNSIIFGYAQHGLGHVALDLFIEMQKVQVKPDHITFVGILSACSHVGLVEEGTKILESMETVYGVPLRMEHYACGVDLFGRAGHLNAAKRLINSMPFEPDAMVWMTLLGACRIHGDIELASQIARVLLLSDPGEYSTYVLISHMYSDLKMWEGKSVIQRAMRDRGLSKVPGWSWIEVNNKVHSFNAEDRSHNQAEEIYGRLRELMEEIGMVYNDADFEFMDIP